MIIYFQIGLEYLFIKRLFDLLFSSLTSLALDPLMLIIVLSVKLGDGGLILYKQVRLTKNGRNLTVSSSGACGWMLKGKGLPIPPK